jgi:hypothetical protein
MISSRRNFLLGVGAVLVAAPTIVRASSLMPIKQMIGDGVALQSIAHPMPDYTSALIESCRQTMERYAADILNITGIETSWLDPEELKQNRGGFKIRNLHEQSRKAGI